MTTQTLELNEAIEALYAAFRKYRRAEVRDEYRCPEEDNSYARYLAQTPLKQLSGVDLISFQVGMGWRFVNDSDFKMLLPRMLDVCAQGEGSLDLLGSYCRLQACAFDKWHDVERKAVQDFTRALLAEAIRHRFAPKLVRPLDVFEIVECAALCEIDVVPLLDEWTATRHPELASSFADHVLLNQWRLLDARRWGGLTELDLPNPVAAWVRSGRAGRFLLSAVEAYPGHPDCGHWAEAHDVLDALGV